MRAQRTTTRLVALVALPAALALAAVTSSPAAAEGTARQINLAPLNGSGANGTAMLSLDGTRLTVKIESRGLVPGQPHAQHIHGSADGRGFRCPDASADKDGDGIVTTSEGLPLHGEINISLTTEGDTSAGSGVAVDRMPVADGQGRLSYERTITVSQDVADHVKDLYVVQHGIDPNGNKQYDFGLGTSDLDPKLPQEATAPAVCGPAEGAAVGSVPAGGVETGSGPRPGNEVAGVLITAGGVAFLAVAGALALGRRRPATTATATKPADGSAA